MLLIYSGITSSFTLKGVRSQVKWPHGLHGSWDGSVIVLAEREGNLQLGSSNLGGVSKEHRQKLERNVHLLLLWVADSDGWLKDAELAFMANQFPVVEE